MSRYVNQTLINIMQMKSEPIASDSPRLMLKLIEDQGCKYNNKIVRLFVRKIELLVEQKQIFYLL